ncbi:MAG: hypothetical protein ABIN89_06925 [Chitinophagaceae bacterium]
MKKLLALCCMLAVFSELGFAQSLAVRRIKIGNTYRETNQFDESERNLISGLSIVQQQKDKYWEAVACENLGLLYRDLEDSVKAYRYFDTASRIYQQLNLDGSRLAMTQLGESMRIKRSEAYAGIDIGSTGIKLSVLQVTLGTEGRYVYNIIKDSSINSNFADLNTAAFEGSKNALKDLFGIMQRYEIPQDRIFVAFSSGVLQEVLRKRLNRDSISVVFERVAQNAMPDYKSQIGFLTPNLESRYTNMGLVLPKSKEKSVSIDIGGGNTKGGYYAFGRFESFSLPFGSRTMPLTAKDTVLPYNIKNELKMFNQTPGIQNMREVFFLGGIVWAMVNVMHPEKAGQDYVTFTYNDVINFQRLTSGDYNTLGSYASDKIEKIPDFETLNKARRNLVETQNTFTAENLRRGAFLLAGIMDEINIPTVKKRYYFLSKGSQIAWITGYIVYNISEKYRSAKE